jgi:UDP-GlcNAc:undecaprenyl-phosphate GlcNAc-1-phosphate transferase
MFDDLQWKMTSLLAVVLSSGLVVFALVPALSRIAMVVGLVDKPDARRKLHERPIPLIGGIAIFLAASMVVVGGVALVPGWLTPNGRTALHFETHHWGLLAASGLILTIGMLDDRFKIKGRFKLLGQIAVATILIATGYFFEKITVGSNVIHFGVFAVLIVYFWILGSINSVNLLDGADGFAGTLGFVVSLAIALMAVVGKETAVEAMIAAAMAGAIGGFLCFNLPPAKIYLGDGGSMLIGMSLGALAISTALKEQTLYAFMAPIAMLTIPIMDTMVAVVRRQMTGRGIYAVDRGHLHHRLLGQGLSPQMAVLWLFVLCGTTALGGLLSFATRESEFAAVSVAIVVGFLVAGKVFGFAEFSMVGRRVRQFSLSAVGFRRDPLQGNSQEFQLQGTRDWGRLFQVAQCFVSAQGLDKLIIDINAPWIHESYHAIWKSNRGKLTEGTDEWHAEFPLVIEGRVYGRILLSAQANAAIAYQCVPKLMDLLESSAPALLELPVATAVGPESGIVANGPRPSEAPETTASPPQPPHSLPTGSSNFRSPENPGAASYASSADTVRDDKLDDASDDQASGLFDSTIR